MAFFSKTKEETANEVPDGFCPNCWGRQQYDGEIREIYEVKQINVNNHKTHYAFIQDFVVNRVEGIKLVNGNNGMQCLVCKTKY